VAQSLVLLPPLVTLLPSFLRRYVITYERELIAEPDDVPTPPTQEKKVSMVSALTNPSGIFSFETSKTSPGPTRSYFSSLCSLIILRIRFPSKSRRVIKD
jgi:hypothetical protein